MPLPESKLEDRLITCRAAAKLMHLKPATIYLYVRQGKLTKYIEKNTGVTHVDMEELYKLKESKPKEFVKA